MRRQQGGFSLLEVLVVIGLIMILAAVASPSLLKAIRNYQTESTAREVGNMILRARYEAMRTNRHVCTACVNCFFFGMEHRFMLDLNSPSGNPCQDPAPSMDPAEPYLVAPNDVWWWNGSWLPGWAAGWPGLPAGYGAADMEATDLNWPYNFRVTFSSRGTVERWNTGTNTWNLATRTQVMMVGRWSPPGDIIYILVTVTPVGKVKRFKLGTQTNWRWQEM